MPEDSETKKITMPAVRKFGWLDIAGIIAVAGFIGLLCHIAGEAYETRAPLSIILTIALVYAIARIVGEFTFFRARVPTVSSDYVTRRKIAELLQQDSSGKARYNIVDLGSGRGELARHIARVLPRARVTAIEYARSPHLQAQLWKYITMRRNLTHLRGDLFTHDVGGYDAVVMFLGKLTQAVGEKLKRELAPGTLVISNDFELGAEWQPVDVINFRTPFRATLYIYRA